MHTFQIADNAVVADSLNHPEGLVLLRDGRLAFVEGYLSRVMVFEDGRVVPSAEVDGMPTALAVSEDGRLLCLRASGKTRSWTAPRLAVPAILEIDLDRGSFEAVETKASGMPLRHPHGLAFGPDGATYFTDCEFAPDRPEVRAWICRLGPAGTEVIFELDNTYPTGIAFDSGGRMTWCELNTKRIARSDPPYSEWKPVADFHKTPHPTAAYTPTMGVSSYPPCFQVASTSSRQRNRRCRPGAFNGQMTLLQRIACSTDRHYGLQMHAVFVSPPTQEVAFGDSKLPTPPSMTATATAARPSWTLPWPGFALVLASHHPCYASHWSTSPSATMSGRRHLRLCSGRCARKPVPRSRLTWRSVRRCSP